MSQRRDLERRRGGVLQSAKAGAVTLLSTVGVLTGIHIANIVLQGRLLLYGIVPQSIDGLVGIFASPFLHLTWEHLAFNSLSLLMLGPFAMLRRRSDFIRVWVIGSFVSGLGTWLIGSPNSVHIGASGVVFAYLGFLMARGIFERSVGAIVLSALVTWLFGGMLWGVLPTVGGNISWEAHLFGFVGGILAARGTPRSAK
ncbi:MAG: rhomboid family intramembrane serine protease [Myxococcota bacterium]